MPSVHTIVASASTSTSTVSERRLKRASSVPSGVVSLFILRTHLSTPITPPSFPFPDALPIYAIGPHDSRFRIHEYINCLRKKIEEGFFRPERRRLRFWLENFQVDARGVCRLPVNLQFVFGNRGVRKQRDFTRKDDHPVLRLGLHGFSIDC